MDSGRVIVIAEAGVNHNGSLDLAMQLVDAAAAAGADMVKFQTFRPNAVISAIAPKADYQVRTTGNVETQLDMVRKLELSESDHRTLIGHCDRKNIQFMSSPFDVPSVELLADVFGLTTLKIPSGEITNPLLLFAVARRYRRVLLSTGMSTLADVEGALAILSYGYTHGDGGIPTLDEAYEAMWAEAGLAALQKNVSLLHCTTEYPSPYVDVNLKAIDTLRSSFGLPVGLSDHTAGIHMAIAAVARGASVIEKHLTLDCTMEGPDHSASLEMGAFTQMVNAIRDVEIAMGDGLKRPRPSERKNMMVARKSIVAATEITRGTLFSVDNVTVKRPGTGISPMRWRDVLGQRAPRDFVEDELIEL